LAGKARADGCANGGNFIFCLKCLDAKSFVPGEFVKNV